MSFDTRGNVYAGFYIVGNFEIIKCDKTRGGKMSGGFGGGSSYSLDERIRRREEERRKQEEEYVDRRMEELGISKSCGTCENSSPSWECTQCRKSMALYKPDENMLKKLE